MRMRLRILNGNGPLHDKYEAPTSEWPTGRLVGAYLYVFVAILIHAQNAMSVTLN
ncbi:unnamed protein product, partial [Ceratitis capitata]